MFNVIRELFGGAPHTLQVLIYQEDQYWFAHCLNMDIVTYNTTEEAVKKDIENLIIAQITFAIQNNNLRSIFVKAPPEYWEKRKHASSCEKRPLNFTVEVPSKKRPLPERKELEFCVA